MSDWIAWFVKNPIAANMLMIIIGVSGFFGIGNLDNEMFPTSDPTSVQVVVPYPGAGSLEVEEQICIRIEEAIADLEGIDEIRSTAKQGLGTVVVEAITGWDTQRLLTDVKSRVDAIDTFPADSERPVVSEILRRAQVLNVAISGNLDENDLKDLAEDIKQDISSFPGVGNVELRGVRETQVAVEISGETLRSLGLSFADIAEAIRNHSVNLPAGQVRNSRGDIQIQTYGQAYRAENFASIPVISKPDGSQVLLGEIASIRETFAEDNSFSFFNRKPNINLMAYVTEEPDFIGVSARINEYLQERRATLPPGVDLSVWFNFADHLEKRLQIMVKNAIQGLVLVFILLMLFLRPVLALWVVAGLAVAYLGTLLTMTLLGVTLSVISTFAFILILGIVVDDAIVVSESIYADYQAHGNAPLSAVEGTQKVAKPVVIAVLTTMVVFVPMLFATGDIANIFAPLSIVAVTALTFSLVESLFILPSHLSYMKPEKLPVHWLNRQVFKMRQRFTGWFEQVLADYYEPLLQRCLQRRGLTLASFTIALLLVLSIFMGGWIKVAFTPDVQGEMVRAFVTLKEGEGLERSYQIRDQLLDAVDAMQAKEKLVNKKGVPLIANVTGWLSDNQVSVIVGLISNEQRQVGAGEIARLWRKYIGEVKQVEDFNIISSQISQAGEKDISLRLSSKDPVLMQRVSDELTRLLASFDGVYEVGDTLVSARKEIRIQLKPYASTVGIGLADIARQVRYAFYGVEVQRIPRLREDVKVLVRFPAQQRQSIQALNSLWLHTASGTEVPFDAVAEAVYQPGYSEIQRVNRQRVVDIKANVNRDITDANQVVDRILKDYWPTMSQGHYGLTLEVAGAQKEEKEFSGEMSVALSLVLLGVFTLLAVEFKSYLQPLIILSAIPFGLAGAIIGHLVLGYNISFLSFFGLMATAGVVVNDNLVLLDRINRLREQGEELKPAIIRAGRDRLRPIFLTSMTTFFGLAPILLNQSVSAKFLKPMVVSLSFGVVLASFVTLLMVPVLYSLVEEFKARRGLSARAEVSLSDS